MSDPLAPPQLTVLDMRHIEIGFEARKVALQCAALVAKPENHRQTAALVLSLAREFEDYILNGVVEGAAR